MTPEEPFHAGELEVQTRLGERSDAARNGRVLSDSVPEGALRFPSLQPFVVLGSRDSEGRPWASLRFGCPGFARTAEPRSVEIDLAGSASWPGDPLLDNLLADPRIGLLFIELGSRRRLRVNGRAGVDGQLLRVAVREAFPNCPKYIQRRHVQVQGAFEAAGVQVRSAQAAASEGPMGAEALAVIRAADTVFVASSNPAGELDASHRGGERGFAKWIAPGWIEIPDYPGNHMYNTLGNFALDPRAGLSFVDFETRRILQLTGSVEMDWEREGSEQVTGGTRRFWRVHIERWRLADLPAGLAFEYLDASPFNPPVEGAP